MNVSDMTNANGTAAGSYVDNISRADAYVRNMEHFDTTHKVRPEYFKPPAPASTVIDVSTMASSEYLIEMSASTVLG